MTRLTILVAAIALLAAACGTDEPEVIGIRASTDPAVGDSRFLFAVNEIDGTRRGSPDEAVTITATSLATPDASFDLTTEFVWIIPDSIGLYKAEIPWTTGGLWEIDFTMSTGEPTEPFLVTVAAQPSTIAVGEPAPLVRTPTVPDTPNVNWVHVEVYEGFNDANFTPDADHLAPAVVEFGLPSEPWIFVMDETGAVMGRIEGVLADGELEQMLDA